MASPFRLFRKYQGTLLVVAGVALMFVFVIGDPLMSYISSAGRGSGGGGGTNPGDVAVRWDRGDLTNRELAQLTMRRRVVSAFLRQVQGEGQYAATDGGRNPAPQLRVQPLNLPDRPEQGIERSVVSTAVLADEARKIGMRISDDQAVRYLQQLGRGYITTEHLRGIISRSRVGLGGASVDYVLDAVREELLARYYFTSFAYAISTVLPEQSWNDWLMVNDRVVVEVASIRSELFLVDVPEPTEDELAEFFELYHERVPLPDRVAGIEMPSPHPGFAIPRKVALHFVRADYAQFLEQAAAAVTDAEIEKYYEDNKDPYFVRAATDLLDDTIGETPRDDAETTADRYAQPAENLDQGEGEDASDEVESDPEVGDLDAGDAGAADAESDAETEAGAEMDAAPSDDEQSSSDHAPRSVFRLVALAEEDEAVAETNDETSDESNGQLDTLAAAEEPASASSAAAPAGAAESTESTESTEPPTQFQPLDEVRDEIRRTIADLKVSEQLSKLMGKLESDLNASYATYLGKVLDAEEAGQDAPPPPPELADLTAMAEEHGLEFQKTVPASALELGSLPIGKTYRSDEASLAPEQRVPFQYVAFDPDLELYEPVTTLDADNNRYLVMKTADTPGSVPELDEVRDEVVSAWRHQQAAELALKHAQAEAKKAESAESLEEYFTGNDDVSVTKTDYFSRYTAGTVPTRTGDVLITFRLSKPDGIDGADLEVMGEIFGLGDGEVGAVLNHDHSFAYVLRVVEHEKTLAELRQAFLSESDRWFGHQAWLNAHQQDARNALQRELLESAGVTWERTPDQPYREEE